MAENEMKRELKTRHLSMIALGGSIGTGLFVTSGSAIARRVQVARYLLIVALGLWFSS